MLEPLTFYTDVDHADDLATSGLLPDGARVVAVPAPLPPEAVHDWHGWQADQQRAAEWEAELLGRLTAGTVA